MRKSKRKARTATAAPKPSIQLHNPVAEHFPAFVFANATHRETMALARLADVAPDVVVALNDFAADAEPEAVDAEFRRLAIEYDATGMVREGSAAGQHIVLCGAGPSLAEHIADYAPDADQLWGCNSALTWLVGHGYRPTHGFAIDQTPAMLGEWASAPDVEYLLASSVHPHLTEYLLGQGRRLRFFHNYVGIPGDPVTASDGTTLAYEDWMYSGLFPPCIRAGSGLNAVSRAIDVALYAGAARISVLGADCAIRVKAPLPKHVVQGSSEHLRWLREDTVMHADGGNALASGATPITFGGTIDGRHWELKPDLCITAQTLRLMADTLPDRIHLIGDTLPNALKGKSAEFLARLPQLTASREIVGVG